MFEAVGWDLCQQIQVNYILGSLISLAPCTLRFYAYYTSMYPIMSRREKTLQSLGSLPTNRRGFSPYHATKFVVSHVHVSVVKEGIELTYPISRYRCLLPQNR